MAVSLPVHRRCGAQSAISDSSSHHGLRLAGSLAAQLARRFMDAAVVSTGLDQTRLGMQRLVTWAFFCQHALTSSASSSPRPLRPAELPQRARYGMLLCLVHPHVFYSRHRDDLVLRRQRRRPPPHTHARCVCVCVRVCVASAKRAVGNGSRPPRHWGAATPNGACCLACRIRDYPLCVPTGRQQYPSTLFHRWCVLA